MSVCGRRLRFFSTDSDQPESCLTSCQRTSTGANRLLTANCSCCYVGRKSIQHGIRLHPTLCPTSGCNNLNSSPPCCKRRRRRRSRRNTFTGRKIYAFAEGCLRIRWDVSCWETRSKWCVLFRPCVPLSNRHPFLFQTSCYCCQACSNLSFAIQTLP